MHFREETGDCGSLFGGWSTSIHIGLVTRKELSDSVYRVIIGESWVISKPGKVYVSFDCNNSFMKIYKIANYFFGRGTALQVTTSLASCAIPVEGIKTCIAPLVAEM